MSSWLVGEIRSFAASYYTSTKRLALLADGGTYISAEFGLPPAMASIESLLGVGHS